MYTIKHAAALTGIPADTLRMWERRYRVVTPIRNQGGYRLYDDAAITRLTAMHALVAAGWAPREAAAQVASGTTLGPTKGRPEDSSITSGNTDDAAVPGADLDLLVRLALKFETATLESLSGRDVLPIRRGRAGRLLADARASTPWRRMATR